MTDLADPDLAAFGVAFALVWGGLALYFAWLHVYAARLARELDDLKTRLK